MANTLYPKGGEALLGDLNLLTADMRVLLIDQADEVYNAADQFVSDVTAAAIVGRSLALSGKAVTNGNFTVSDPTVATVTGDTVEALILFEHTGVDATARVVVWIDTEQDGATPIAFTPNGSNVLLDFHASGLFSI